MVVRFVKLPTIRSFLVFNIRLLALLVLCPNKVVGRQLFQVAQVQGSLTILQHTGRREPGVVGGGAGLGRLSWVTEIFYSLSKVEHRLVLFATIWFQISTPAPTHFVLCLHSLIDPFPGRSKLMLLATSANGAFFVALLWPCAWLTFNRIMPLNSTSLVSTWRLVWQSIF